MTIARHRVPVLCGQLLVGGFDGVELPPRYAMALREGRRGGAILFRRNLPDLASAARLCAAVHEASMITGPFVGVDQEGGRVTRLPAPFLAMPPARVLGALDDPGLVRRASRALAVELAALGFNLNFAPVLDVDSNPENPVIGDRSFARDPRVVARTAIAFARGLAEGGVIACGKHFPGHGDTSVDSHLELPSVGHGRARLDAVELAPFRAATAAGIAALMSAHVVCEALDPGVPATLSRAICTDLLRGEIEFRGVLFSDDLEMKAIAARWPIEEAAVAAVRAGCDAVLICRDEDAQDRAYEALVREAERDAGFRARVEEAAGRVLELRAANALAGGSAFGSEGKAVLAAIAARVAAAELS